MKENIGGAKGSSEGMSAYFNTATNILNSKVPLENSTNIIQNITFSFVDELLMEGETESENNMEITPELGKSLFFTLGKLGSCMILKSSKSNATESTESIKSKCDQLIKSISGLGEKMINNLDPGTELDGINTESFSISGGNIGLADITNKVINREGDTINLPKQWNISIGGNQLGEDNAVYSGVVRYKHVAFQNNPRLDLGEKVVGGSQNFSLYHTHGELNVTYMEHPLLFNFELYGVNRIQAESLNCSFYNESMNAYITDGIITISKLTNEQNVTFIQCSTTHLSDFAIAVEPGTAAGKDVEYLATQNNLSTLKDIDKIDELDPTKSIGNYIYIYIYIV